MHRAPVGEIEACLNPYLGKTPLESFKLFDVYMGNQVKENHKSVAYSLTFRAPDRTLTDKEVAAQMSEITAKLCDKFHAEIRE